MPRPPSTVVTMKTSRPSAICSAGAPTFSTAQLTGKVRVEGEALNAFVIAAIVTRFRAEAPKRLQRFLVKGAST